MSSQQEDAKPTKPSSSDWRRKLIPSVKITSMLTAISSMAIAAMSLHYTLEAQRVDLEYKEVSIRPRLILSPREKDWGLVAVNNGLGPASIKDVVVKVDNQCHHSLLTDAGEWRTISLAFSDKILRENYTDVIPPSYWNEMRNEVAATIPAWGMMIRAGDSFEIFRLAEGALFDIRKLDENTSVNGKKLEENVSVESKKLAHIKFMEVKTEFARKIVTIPLNMYVCSATERFCEWIGPELDCERSSGKKAG